MSDPGQAGNEVQVAFARGLIEAEMIQGLLSDAGIPSARKQLQSFGRLAPTAGSHAVLVDGAAAPRAKALLAETFPASEEEAGLKLEDEVRRRRIGREAIPLGFTLRFAAVALAAIALIWILDQLLS